MYLWRSVNEMGTRLQFAYDLSLVSRDRNSANEVSLQSVPPVQVVLVQAALELFDALST